MIIMFNDTLSWIINVFDENDNFINKYDYLFNFSHQRHYYRLEKDQCGLYKSIVYPLFIDQV